MVVCACRIRTQSPRARSARKFGAATSHRGAPRRTGCASSEPILPAGILDDRQDRPGRIRVVEQMPVRPGSRQTSAATRGLPPQRAASERQQGISEVRRSLTPGCANGMKRSHRSERDSCASTQKIAVTVVCACPSAPRGGSTPQSHWVWPSCVSIESHRAQTPPAQTAAGSSRRESNEVTRSRRQFTLASHSGSVRSDRTTVGFASCGGKHLQPVQLIQHAVRRRSPPQTRCFCLPHPRRKVRVKWALAPDPLIPKRRRDFAQGRARSTTSAPATLRSTMHQVDVCRKAANVLLKAWQNWPHPSLRGDEIVDSTLFGQVVIQI